MRSAIYARFSSDLQDIRSITDQVNLARRYSETRGLTTVGTYEDAGISGASMANRPGLQRLLSDAAARHFDVVVTESLDRLSRSQADIAMLYERLTFLGVRIETLADGVVSEIHVGLKGTMAALFLKDLAQKTRRGQIGRVKAGRIPGGRCYGYDVVQAVDDRGRRTINTLEAQIVQRIFTEYAAGQGALAIVKGLNSEGIKGPSGGMWNVSALLGSPKRRNGLLHNELYRGTIVYNRQRFVKDPATGKRVSRPNPESEWLRQEVPELRIIDDDLWMKAQAQRRVRGENKLHYMRRPQRLLSGLIYCGVCGARYNIATRGYLRCSRHANSGMCSESRMIQASEVEQRVLTSIEKHLLNEDMIELAVGAFKAEFESAAAEVASRYTALNDRLRDVEQKIDRLLRLVEEGHADPSIAGPRLNKLSETKTQIQSQFLVDHKRIETPDVASMAHHYRDLVRDLRNELTHEETGNAEAVSLVRSLVRRITVPPKAANQNELLAVEAGCASETAESRYCTVGCGGRI